MVGCVGSRMEVGVGGGGGGRVDRGEKVFYLLWC